jgi:hypothetical protein
MDDPGRLAHAYGSEGWASSPSERATVCASQRHVLRDCQGVECSALGPASERLIAAQPGDRFGDPLDQRWERRSPCRYVGLFLPPWLRRRLA